jgi:hypothetical protein
MCKKLCFFLTLIGAFLTLSAVASVTLAAERYLMYMDQGDRTRL